MLSMLQSRIRQFSKPVAAPQLQAPKRPNPASADAVPMPGLTGSRNPALRTIGGASLFEGTPAKPSVNADPLAAPAASGSTLEFRHPEPPEEQQAAVAQAVAGNGKPVDFLNSDGKTEQVVIEQVPSSSGQENYSVRVGDDTFSVEFQDETTADRKAFLAQVIDSYSETPPELRDSLDKVVVTPDKGPTTATGGAAAATAGDGTISFYEDGKHLHEGVFHHELAHLIGRQQENNADSSITKFEESMSGETPPVPNGWETAAKADGNFTSSYAETDYNRDGNYTEDFADAWRRYMTALDEGPEAVAAFREQHPERAEILEDLYSGANG
ncbi:hypothetical protein ACLESD_14505 [Pyxidicoccus sp. 3LFB2]